jgi:hypothetical protein
VLLGNDFLALIPAFSPSPAGIGSIDWGQASLLSLGLNEVDPFLGIYRTPLNIPDSRFPVSFPSPIRYRRRISNQLVVNIAIHCSAKKTHSV